MKITIHEIAIAFVVGGLGALAGGIPAYFLEWNHLIFLFGMFGAAIAVYGYLLQAYWKQSKTKEKPAGEDKTDAL